VIEQLKTDHNQIGRILGNMEKLLDGITSHPEQTSATRVRAELDGLEAIMETHFTHEGKKLISVLNALNVSQWRGRRPDFLLARNDVDR
jgi:hypothetical protein